MIGDGILRKKEIVAMILAGGQGTRLGVLTENMAKPAVHYGGKYRIIDFPLSNCANSGIEAIGVVTQYKPQELNMHIGLGEAWGLDIEEAGVSLLPPYQDGIKDNWYKGTANAIFQNIDYIDSYDPEYVLILSGDHIYKMNYENMLDFHKKKKCDATIAVMEVPMNEANRFGIMNTDDELIIYEFEEKPSEPKNNLASMGIYIFKWQVLREYLLKDEDNKFSENDFGKNIIPLMLRENRSLCAYPFRGYWKDVGTIQSLWEANMDLLDDSNELDLFNDKWPIYTNGNTKSCTQYIGSKALIKKSLVVDGCHIEGNIYNSVICNEVYVGKNAVIKDSVIMPGAVIEDNVIINKAIIGKNTIVKKDIIVGDGKEVVALTSSNKSLVHLG